MSAWIDGKWTAETSRCPICRHDEWILGDYVVTPPRFGGGRVQVSGALAPVVMLVCGNCAHTLFFNAAMIGVVAATGAEDENGVGGEGHRPSPVADDRQSP